MVDDLSLIATVEEVQSRGDIDYALHRKFPPRSRFLDGFLVCEPTMRCPKRADLRLPKRSSKLRGLHAGAEGLVL